MSKKQKHATKIAEGALSTAAISRIGGGPEKTTTVSAAATGSKERLAFPATSEREE